jgi:hypothetical protein
MADFIGTLAVALLGLTSIVTSSTINNLRKRIERLERKQ